MLKYQRNRDCLNSVNSVLCCIFNKSQSHEISVYTIAERELE